jgi:tetratricopeptide (TPR) repeat protein
MIEALVDRFSWMLLRTQVFVYVLLGLREQAIAYLRQMRAARPDDFFVLTTLAHFLGQREEGKAAPNRAESIALLKQALGLQPHNAVLHFNLAFLLEAQGHLPDAETAFRRALAIDEKLDRAWYGLGLVLIRQRRLEEALSALQRNTVLQPMSPFAWYQMARVHLDLNQPEQTEAIIRHLQGFEPKVAKQLRRETGLAGGCLQQRKERVP